jgi:hypothetical protein
MHVEKWQNLFKNILIYYAFVMCVLVTRTPSSFLVIFDYLPSIDILFLYSFFFIIKEYTPYIYLHMFLLGLILDTFNFLPLGISGLSLLLTYKILNFVSKVLFAKNSLLFFAINNLVFLTLHFMLTWFLLSLYQSKFVTITPVFLTIVKNALYFNLMNLLYKRFKK